MATSKKTQIVITANAAVAKKVMDELAQRTDAIKQKMAALDVTTEKGKREFNKLNKELVSYNSATAQNITNEERVKHAIDNLSTTSLSKLRTALASAKKVLGTTFQDDPNLKKKQQDVRTLQAQIDKLTGSVHKQGGAWSTAMKNLTAYVGLFQVFNKVKDLVTGAIKKNLDYSGSLTDIRKVSGLTMDDVNKLSTELSKIDTRTSVEGLAKLAYEGAKLGVGKYGVDGMKQFVAAADKINVAIGEEMGDKALPALLKMTEVMGLIPKMGLEKSIEATGSAMFKLSSTSTATSNDIVEFAKRCTGVARTAGITTDQLLALGSAFSAQMASPEVAATAMSKFIVALQKNHNLIEKDLSIPAGTINSMYTAGHAMDAIVLILEKMKEKGNMNALGEIFKDVGGDGQRLISSMVTMAKNVDMLKDHLYESKDAFDKATAVGDEYAMQQQSAIGILERANNLWEKAFVNPDGVDTVKEMAKWWYTMSATMTSSPLLKGTLWLALSSILNLIKALSTLLPVVIGYLVSQGVFMAITNMKGYAQAVWAAIKAMGAYIVSLRTANTAQATLNATTKVNPWVALASVIFAVVGAVYGYVQQTKEAARAQAEAARKANEWRNNIVQAQMDASTLTRKLANYKRILENVNMSQDDRNKTIRRFNHDFHSYITNLGIEINNVDDLRKHYKALSIEIRKASFYRSREKSLEEGLAGNTEEMKSAARQLAEALKLLPNGSTVDISSIQGMIDSRKYGPGQIFNKIKQMTAPSKTKTVYRGGKLFNVKKTEVDLQVEKTQMAALYKQVWKKLNYLYNSTRRYTKKENDIYEDYERIGLDRDYTPYTEEDIGTLSNDAPDKGGSGTGGGKGHHDTGADKIKKEKQQAETRSKALIANIKAFYEEQKRKYLEWVTTVNADGEKVSEGQQQQMIDYIDTRMKTATGLAKHSIATLSGEWEKFLKDMPVKDMMVQTDETSENLIEAIKESDVKELHDLFEKLSVNLSKENHKTIAENLGSLLDQTFANGSKELREAAEKLLAQQREIQKILNENDYTGAVNRDTRSNFDKLGLLKPANGIRADSSSGLQQMNESFDALTTKARSSVDELYKLDPASDLFESNFLKYLSVANEGFDFSSLGLQKLKVLYYELIKYTETYTEAEKRAYDTAKKIAEQSWATMKRNLDNQEKLRKLQNESQLYGKRNNFLSNLGLKDVPADPEVELMKARMRAAQDYYAFVFANSKNMQLVREADKARQEAELNYANQMATAMKSRLSQMRSMVQPIEDFGASVGQALAEMKNDADSANEAIKNALKSMLESWAKMALNDVNTQMWKTINDAGARKAKDKAQPDIQAGRDASAKAAANGELNIPSDLGTAANPIHAIIDSAPPSIIGMDDGSGENATGRPFSQTKSVGGVETVSTGYNPGNAPVSSTTAVSPAVTNAASQAGGAAASVATGQSSLGEAAAGMAGSAIGTIMNTDFGSKQSRREKREQRKQQREARKHQRELTKEAKKGAKEREKINKKGNKEITKSTEEESKAQVKTEQMKQSTTTAIVDTALNTNFQKKKDNDQKVVEQSKNTANAELTFSIVGAVGKCFEFLGPIAGPIAAAAVMALLTGLMQWGLNAAFGGNKNKNNSPSGKSTKIVSGMLTYDSGNVQDMKPFVADNGEIYWAEDKDSIPQSGVNLLTAPTATTINGQRSLVAENGPELVVGRETTRAMMMNNPSLLKALVNYDRNYSGRNAARRTFDEGNISEATGSLSSSTPITEDVIANSTASNVALLQAVNVLLQRLNEPISAKIDMYGRGNLYDSMTKANQFMKNKS